MFAMDIPELPRRCVMQDSRSCCSICLPGKQIEQQDRESCITQRLGNSGISMANIMLSAHAPICAQHDATNSFWDTQAAFQFESPSGDLYGEHIIVPLRCCIHSASRYT